jgi:endonuclease/exonuclease/phosphatase family metal-dependent hydrolase
VLALGDFSSTLHAVALGKRGIRLVLTGAVILLALPGSAPVAAPSGATKTEPEVLSPNGQISVVTANARQIAIVDVRHFRRMLGLTVALRNRPPAWDGGFEGAVTAPDVIILQEISDSNLDIVNKLLKQRSTYKYEPLAAPGSHTKFLVNVDTVALQGDPETWTDPCFPGSEGKEPRMYQLAHFIEISSGVPFSVAGVHLYKNYSGTGLERCRERNTEELRAQLADETGAVIVGGDFNFRAKATAYECDLNEDSEPNEWWSMMTAPSDGGRVYLDAVHETNRRDGTSMVGEWTHEQDAPREVCTGTTQHKRARIDYLFATGAAVAEAHADHPGWAGEEPGTVDPENKKYSDHRFVWGRFALGGPPAPQPITTAATEGGGISLSWPVVEGAAGYLLYRAVEGYGFSLVTQLDGATSTYVDESAEDGTTYVYAIASIDAAGLQGVEATSGPVSSDSTGPRVVDVDPSAGAEGVPRNATIEVTFDEAFAPMSVGDNTIKLTLKGRSIAGVVEERSEKTITFDPRSLLKKGKTYKVIVRGVRDSLGNKGKRFDSTFSTVEPSGGSGSSAP